MVKCLSFCLSLSIFYLSTYLSVYQSIYLYLYIFYIHRFKFTIRLQSKTRDTTLRLRVTDLQWAVRLLITSHLKKQHGDKIKRFCNTLSTPYTLWRLELTIEHKINHRNQCRNVHSHVAESSILISRLIYISSSAQTQR